MVGKADADQKYRLIFSYNKNILHVNNIMKMFYIKPFYHTISTRMPGL
jgi:hypothetical protein